MRLQWHSLIRHKPSSLLKELNVFNVRILLVLLSACDVIIVLYGNIYCHDFLFILFFSSFLIYLSMFQDYHSFWYTSFSFFYYPSRFDRPQLQTFPARWLKEIFKKKERNLLLWILLSVNFLTKTQRCYSSGSVGICCSDRKRLTC